MEIPAAHSVSPGTGTIDQEIPPSKLTPATLPRAPPLDHRPCCQKATMLSGLTGLTSTQGSTSLSRKTVPGSMFPGKFPQFASAPKGLNSETCTRGPVPRASADAVNEHQST